MLYYYTTFSVYIRGDINNLRYFKVRGAQA